MSRGWRYISVPQTRFPRWAVIRRFASTKTDFEDFGDYSIILPEEPFVFGTSHIKPRFVPAHIHRPSYVVGKGSTLYQEPPPNDPGKIKLGTNEEVRIREAAALARKVREFAKSLVHVCVYYLCRKCF